MANMKEVKNILQTVRVIDIILTNILLGKINNNKNT